MLLCLTLMSLTGISSHFSGSTIWYECLGGNKYRLFHSFYFDCGSISSIAPVSMNTPNWGPTVSYRYCNGASTTFSNTTWTILNAQDITPVCPGFTTSCQSASGGNTGFMQGVFYKDVVFSPPAGCNQAFVSIASCCRAYTLTNGAGGTSIMLTTGIPLNLCNEAAFFPNPPTVQIPVGQTSSFSYQAIDPDGDSLAYSLVDCMQGGITIPYNPGYSATAPLGPTWNVSIDPQTGLLSFVPIGAGSIVNATICIQVDEYRNGQLISSTIRDQTIYSFNIPAISAAPSVSLSNIQGAYTHLYHPYRIAAVAGVPLHFEFDASLANGNPVFYTSNYDFFLPNASVSGGNILSPLHLNFDWTPTLADTGIVYLSFDFVDNLACNHAYHTYRTIEVRVLPQAPFDVTANVLPTDCLLPTGSVSLTVNGPNPPFTYSWNTGASTQNLANLGVGTYDVQIVDSKNWVYHSPTFFINADNISVNINAYPPDCGLANGSIAAQVSGGQSPYSYSWNTGSTTDSIFNLLTGGYSVDITDANGCFYHGVQLLAYDPADSCESLITGFLYKDLNNNCIWDVGEPPIPYTYLNLTPGGAALTDANGQYQFTVNQTGVYHINLIPDPANQISSACIPSLLQNINVSQLGPVYTADFPLNYLPDFSVKIGGYAFVPGFHHTTNLWVRNNSSFSDTVTLLYQHEPLFYPNFFSAPFTSYDTANHTLVWQVDTLGLGSILNINITGPFDPLATIGSTANESVQIFPTGTDINPTNNVDTLVRLVTASFDPNQKSAYPIGQGPQGLIPENTPRIDYLIDFQNTGNHPATFVILRDTIDDDLDITTFRFSGASHPCSIYFEDDKVAVFTFDNINLPDSASDYYGSMGYVKFSLDLKPQLALDTRIDNGAAIYFDFNAPIFTNITRHTLYREMEVTALQPVCVGGTQSLQTFFGKAPYTLSWNGSNYSSSNGLFNLPANVLPGNYSLSVEDAYGMHANVNFTLSAAADANFSYQQNGVSFGFTPAVGNLASYFWDFGNGNTDSLPNPSQTFTPGTYTVTLTTTDVCGNTATASQQISLISGLDAAAFQQQVRISPNPGTDLLRLSFPNPSQSPYVFILTDMGGRRVLSVSGINTEQLDIRTDKLGTGSYTWQLQGKEKASGIWVKE